MPDESEYLRPIHSSRQKKHSLLIHYIQLKYDNIVYIVIINMTFYEFKMFIPPLIRFFVISNIYYLCEVLPAIECHWRQDDGVETTDFYPFAAAAQQS